MVDSHAHLQLLNNLEDKISVAMKEGIKYILCVGIDRSDSEKVIEIANRFENIFCSVGIHPLSSWTDSDLKQIEELSKNEKVVAIGETGLDFFKGDDFKRQIELLKFHVELAEKLKKPLVIHTRGIDKSLDSSFDVCFDIIRQKNVSAVFHCFSWGENELKKAQENGFFISFSGMITYSKRIQRVSVVSDLTLTLIETDSPFLSPVKGKENEPSYVKFVAETLSRIRNIEFQELKNILIENFEKLFLRR